MARPRSDIAPRIVRAARARFLTHGVDAASLRDIAAAARTSIGMVYYYFPTKDDLFLAVVEEVYGRLLEELGEALAGETPFEVRIQRLYARFAAMTDDELTVVRIVVRELLTSTGRRKKLIDRFLRGHIPMLLGVVAEGRRHGEIAERLHPMAVGLSMMLLGLFPQIVRRLGASALPAVVRPPDPEELANQLAEIVLHGVRGRR